ncbi:hypothetical protein [Vagococcus salmoninarum]|uniref:hypothetical protein n=1 Tax=Vagococcus salmoninarum TaxID=2739 RepID=UPI003F9B71F7
MLKLLLIAGIIGFVLGGIALTHYLEKKKWLPNRWITGPLVFLIILIPSVILPWLPLFIKQGFYGLSAVLAIVFFETTRLMLERGQYRGIVKADDFNKKEAK